MSGLRIKDVPIGTLKRMGAKPMTPWEVRSADTVPMARAALARNERWRPTVYVNNRYVVQLSDVDTSGYSGSIGSVVHLWIRAHTGEMPRSWSDLQWIKNTIIGPDRTAVEVFPAVADLVDEANMAHLWVYPADFTMPFGLRR
jgi:hypothetical protein